MERLREEAREKESFLQDIRSEAMTGAEALKTASLIKQVPLLPLRNVRCASLMEQVPVPPS